MQECNKNLIRKRLIELRENLPEEDVINNSAIIADSFLNLTHFNNSKVVMGYMSFRNEVMTDSLIVEILKRDKRVAIPRIEILDNGFKDIVAYEVKDIYSQVERGTFGVREPIKNVAVELNPEDIDLIIIPGVGFDTRGFRIGFGAGYYDRFLKKVRPDCLKVGFAFEMQILEKIPEESHDIPVDMVITEKRIIV